MPIPAGNGNPSTPAGARLVGPDEAYRTVFLRDGRARARGYEVPLFLDEAATVPADVLTLDGEPIPDSTVIVDAHSRIPLFQFPPDVDVVYTSVNGGPVVPLYARVDFRLDQLAERLGGIDGDVGSALAAEAAARSAAITAATTAAAADATAKANAVAAASLPRTAGKNLFDQAAAAGPGKFWNGVGTTPIDLAGWYASALIPVTVGQTYTINNCRNYEYLNADGEPSGFYGNNPSEGPVTFTIPAGTAYVVYNVADTKVAISQMEVGATATTFEPYGYVLPRQLVGGKLLTDVGDNVTALSRLPNLSVFRSGNTMLVRCPFDSTRDLLLPLHTQFGDEGQVTYANSALSLVSLCPAATPDSAIWPTPTTGTPIHSAADDNAPINAGGWSYIGGNHGWGAGWTLTAAGHGKTTADLGSTWSDGTRTYTLLAVLSSSTLLLAGPYTVSSGVVTGSVIAPAATLTHVAGATNTGAVGIGGGTVFTQIHPSSYGHTVTVELDGKTVPDGKSAGQLLTIAETYLIASYKGLVDWAQTNIGNPVLSNLSSVPVYARVSNTYRITPNTVVAAQKVTAVEKITLTMGVTQAYPVSTPAGGLVRQFMPGVGTVNGVNYSTLANLAGVVTQADIGPAAYLNPLLPATSMTQWAYDSGGAAQYGLAMGILPTGDGHPSQRVKNAATKSWFIASATKKNYPQIAWLKTLNTGESLSGTAYRRYLAPPDTATELVVTDGTDTWVVIERTSIATDARVAAPHLLGRRLVPATLGTITAADRVTGDGVTYSAPTTPGYGVWRAASEAARLETIPGATNGTGTYFVLAQGTVSTVALTGSYQVLYLHPMYLPEATPVDRACIEVTAVGTGVVRHGVYLTDPATGQPVLTGPFADFGVVDVTTTGVKETTLAPAVLLPAGWHWYGLVWQQVNTTAPTLRVMSTGLGIGPLNIGTTSAAMSGSRMGVFQSGVAGALTALTISGTHQLTPPRVAYRRA